jgi:hypothetical protein
MLFYLLPDFLSRIKIGTVMFLQNSGTLLTELTNHLKLGDVVDWVDELLSLYVQNRRSLQLVFIFAVTILP